MVSEIFDPERWRRVEGFSFTDITYHRAVGSGTVRVAIDRPEVRNAFRPHTVDELYRALDHARMSGDVGCVLLTGNGPSPKDGGWAFCSGGDQRIRGRDGYRYADGETAETIDPARAGRQATRPPRERQPRRQPGARDPGGHHSRSRSAGPGTGCRSAARIFGSRPCRKSIGTPGTRRLS